MSKVWLVLVALPLMAEEPVSFQKQIRPILARQCAACHQPASKQSELLVTTYDGLLKGGRKGAAFVAGKPDESVVIGYLTGKTSPQMPFGGKPLAAEQIDLFKRWILEGAKNDSPPENLDLTTLKPAVYYAPPLITALAYSPDGKMMIVGIAKELPLFDSVSGKPLSTLKHKSGLLGCRFSPDCQSLLCAGGGDGATLWDLKSKKSQLLEHGAYGAEFSADGTLIATAGDDNHVMIWKAKGDPVTTLEACKDTVFHVAFSPNGKRLVSIDSSGGVRLWDTKDWKLLGESRVAPATAGAPTPSWYPDSRRFAVGGDKMIAVYDV